MMRRVAFLSGAIVALCLLLPASAVRAQERWAALASNDEASASVVWGDSREDASKRAVAACRKISKLCADVPATTPNPDDIFTVMCCNNPRHACAVGVDSTNEASLAMVQKVFDDAGFSACKVVKHMSARTGGRID
jgi:hypothetical protein